MKEGLALIEQARREQAERERWAAGLGTKTPGSQSRTFPDVPAHEKTGLHVLRRILLIYVVLALCMFACVRCAGEPKASPSTPVTTPFSQPTGATHE